MNLEIKGTVEQHGLLITFEGMEGAGKTTQAQRLSEALVQEGHKVCVTREPGGTPISEEIRNIFLNPNHNEMVSTTELLLIAAARAQHVSEVILPALQDRNVVISDRFSDATVAYQGYRHGLDLDLIRRLNYIATGGLSPERTFVLDLPVEIGLHRVRQRQGAMNRLDLEVRETHNRIREAYLSIASQEPNRVSVIDAQADVDSIHKLIAAEVNGLLRTKGMGRKL